MGLRNKRPHRLNYAVNKIAAKSWSKVTNAVIHYKTLLEREAFEGSTKWLQNAKTIVLAKMKKYWINLNKI